MLEQIVGVTNFEEHQIHARNKKHHRAGDKKRESKT
jgi:hypothetical protein